MYVLCPGFPTHSRLRAHLTDRATQRVSAHSCHVVTFSLTHVLALHKPRRPALHVLAAVWCAQHRAPTRMYHLYHAHIAATKTAPGEYHASVCTASGRKHTAATTANTNIRLTLAGVACTSRALHVEVSIVWKPRRFQIKYSRLRRPSSLLPCSLCLLSASHWAPRAFPLFLPLLHYRSKRRPLKSWTANPELSSRVRHEVWPSSTVRRSFLLTTRSMRKYPVEISSTGHEFLVSSPLLFSANAFEENKGKWRP